ncbi:hypothetical protein [Aurantimonas marina]|uniref:hypothetical protein n=1 Tax=Aurantimonas marina TaxID=2780508 RepID=UPI0019D19F10
MSGTATVWLFGVVSVFLAAASASRYYVSTNSLAVLIFALSLYTLGNLMMIRLMRESGLGVAISASAIAQLVLINIVAVTVFGERPPLPQVIGMILGIAAFTLMVWPSSR